MAELTGFTLFWQPVKKGWQMSVRRADEPGWSVSTISEEQAAAVLALLQNSGHPDGPWEIRKPGSIEAAIEEAIEARRAWTAAL